MNSWCSSSSSRDGGSGGSISILHHPPLFVYTHAVVDTIYNIIDVNSSNKIYISNNTVNAINFIISSSLLT